MKQTEIKGTPKSIDCLDAVLSYVTAPTPEQLVGIQRFLKKTYRAESVRIVEEQDTSLGGGFKLQVGTDEFDWSTKEKVRQLEEKLTNAVKKEHDSSKEIITIFCPYITKLT